MPQSKPVLTVSEMLERLTIAMTCHVPTSDCKSCRRSLGEIYDTLKYVKPKGVTFNLTPTQAAKVIDVLDSHQDEGPAPEGWSSLELRELAADIRKQMEERTRA